MHLIPLMSALFVLGPLAIAPVLAEEPAPAAEALTVEQRLALLESEVAALRAQLDTEALAQAIAEQVVVAQQKAREPRTPEEAVAKVAADFNLDQEQQDSLIEIMEEQEQAQQDLMTSMRSGDIPRDQIRDRWNELRENNQSQLSALLSEDQIQKLREAQRPPAAGSSRGWGSMMGSMMSSGGWGGRGGDGRRGGGDRNRGGTPPEVDF